MKQIWNLPKVEIMPFSEIVEKRPVLLVTSAPAWDAVRNHLRGLNISKRIEVTEANTAHWDSILSTVNRQSSMVIYAIGGGNSGYLSSVEEFNPVSSIYGSFNILKTTIRGPFTWTDAARVWSWRASKGSTWSRAFSI